MTGRTGPGPGPATPRRRTAGLRGHTIAALLAVLLPALLLATPGAHADGPSASAPKPAVTLSDKEAGKGGSLTVKGSGWRSGALLMLLVCGQSSPARGVIGGTNSCANADGRAVTTDTKGAFSTKLPVSEPPVPCPCVVHVATVTGEEALADAVFVVAGHPVAALPKQTGQGKLAVLAATRLEGDSSVLTWFGAPPTRRLVFTVGNMGSAPVENPVFRVGTAHGVYAPQWEERQWRGTVEPGRKARIELPVELAAGAHGDYRVSLKYGTKVLAEQPWGVGRPWGVTLFWILLCLVVPAAVFRIGMAIVDRVRPRSAQASRGGRRASPFAGAAARLARLRRTPAAPVPTTTAGEPRVTGTAALPWFTPESAPSEHSPTTKGHS